MPGVFDRLQSKIADKQAEGGITALDLADLSPVLRKIMRLMLRELEMSYPRLCEVMDAMPEGERLSRTDLSDALNTLTQQAWLIRIGEKEKAIYKANMRRKAGSNLMSDIWANLDDKVGK